MPKIEHTVGTLIEELKKYPLNMRVVLEDADTNWRIPKLSLCQHNGEVVIEPCDYGEMDSFKCP